MKTAPRTTSPSRLHCRKISRTRPPGIFNDCQQLPIQWLQRPHGSTFGGFSGLDVRWFRDRSLPGHLAPRTHRPAPLGHCRESTRRFRGWPVEWRDYRGIFGWCRHRRRAFWLVGRPHRPGARHVAQHSHLCRFQWYGRFLHRTVAHGGSPLCRGFGHGW